MNLNDVLEFYKGRRIKGTFLYNLSYNTGWMVSEEGFKFYVETPNQSLQPGDKLEFTPYKNVLGCLCGKDVRKLK